MEKSRPNILILFTDMQRADTIAALGNSVIKTPNIDRLVTEGTSFTNCFTPSPVCVPGRCCMHYGLYPQKTGVTDNSGAMPDNRKSYPAVLAENGYLTHAVGKCHFTPDGGAMRGFQSRQIQEECESDPARDDYIAWLQNNGYDDFEPHGARGDMYYIPQVSPVPAEAHPSQWIGNESCRFVQDHKETSQPWCLFSSFIHPHPPFSPPKPWHKLYNSVDMPLPIVSEDSEEMLFWINRLQNRYKYRDHGIDLNLMRMIKAYYYATISFVDYQVGRIITELEAAGELDNTLVLFASDHGDYLGDYNCFGKRSMHDASSRVPMIVRYPARFQSGEICSTATSLCDLFPTLLSAADITYNDLELDGLDLAAVSQDKESERIVYSQFSDGATAIYMAVNKNWKYVYSAGDDKELFFDRLQDPEELNNISGSENVIEAKNMMKNYLLSYLVSVGATEAYIETNGKIEWKHYPHIEEEYLENPDEKLLTQDYYSTPLDLPGYTD